MAFRGSDNVREGTCMKAAEGAFHKLAGMPLTDEQRQRLYAVRDTLQLTDNDALWSLMGALEWQRTFLEETPDRLGAVLNKALQDTKIVADRTIEASAAKAQERLVKILGEAAQKVAAETAGTKYMWAFAAAIIVSVFAMSGIWLLADRWGYNRGYAEAYAITKDEKVAAEWGNSAEGRLGKRMAEIGTLNKIANCSGPGWRTAKAPNGQPACYAGDGSGWYLP